MPAAMTPETVIAVPEDFAQRVVAWQRVHGRHGLPWQNTRDAYRIWLSEIMLQQTQVTTVLRYYEPFLHRFPSVAHLAAASTDDVLASWSGLGYYSRARNLHACARAVMNVHGGVFPTDADVLETLPGIGRSTAAAVAAFSSGQRRAILDGNVKRVLARHRAYADDLARPAGLERLWQLADALLPERGIEAYTQGLMDLGATVCTLRRPACALCPVQADCAAQALGRPLDFPVKTRRVKRGARDSLVLFVVGKGGGTMRPADAVVPQVLLVQRPSTGIWAGLWTPPLFDDDVQMGQGIREFGLGPYDELEAWPPVVHALTHLDWTLRPRVLNCSKTVASGAMGEVAAAQACDAAPRHAWFTLNEALELGLPAPVRRLLEDLLARY
jgi:A/G-specific adenine glycosylase